MLRARIEMGLAVLATALAVLTAVWPAWIEGLGLGDPDGGNGEVEILVVVALLAAAAALAWLGSRSLRAARGAPAPHTN
jgi:hypothetical protein